MKLNPGSIMSALLPQALAGARRVLALIAVLLLAACATETPLPGRPDLLDFLVDGQTPATEVYLRLGPPAARFEDGSIATWRLDQDATGYRLVSSQGGWQGVRYELVVVFSAARVVERHSLVAVRSP